MPSTEEEWDNHFELLASDNLLDILASSSLEHRDAVMRILLDRGIDKKDINEEVKRRIIGHVIKNDVDEKDYGPVSPEAYGWGNIFLFIILCVILIITLSILALFYYGILIGFVVLLISSITSIVFVRSHAFENSMNNLAIWQYEHYKKTHYRKSKHTE